VYPFVLVCVRLLDQGFEKDVLTIVDKLNEAKAKSSTHRCNVLLSATLNERIQKLAMVRCALTRHHTHTQKLHLHLPTHQSLHR
jgi:superfamily II DNA/RNA helicase